MAKAVRPERRWQLSKAIYQFGLQFPPPVNKEDYLTDPLITPIDHLRPVASSPPNALGLFDFEGNAWEWLSGDFPNPGDLWDSTYGWTRHQKLVGGGGFGLVSNYSSEPMPIPEGDARVGRIEAIGFRLVLTRRVTTISRHDFKDF